MPRSPSRPKSSRQSSEQWLLDRGGTRGSPARPLLRPTLGRRVSALRRERGLACPRGGHVSLGVFGRVAYPALAALPPRLRSPPSKPAAPGLVSGLGRVVIRSA